MALTSCKDCGGEVSNEAPTCPHCGSRRDPGANKRVYWIGAVIGLVVLAGLVGRHGEDSTDTASGAGDYDYCEVWRDMPDADKRPVVATNLQKLLREGEYNEACVVRQIDGYVRWINRRCGGDGTMEASTMAYSLLDRAMDDCP